MSPSTLRGFTASPLVLMRAALPDLAPAERRVIELALRDPKAAAAMKISDLAKSCNTSDTTVVRAARALGYTGYADLRRAFATAAGVADADPQGPVPSEILADDSLRDIVSKVAYADAHAITDTAAQLDLDSLRKAERAITSATRIEIFGIGASGIVAADLEQKLLRIGYAVHASLDVHATLTSTALMDKRSVLVVFSHTGESPEIVDLLNVAKGQGATRICITNHPSSRVAQASSVVLTTAARETTFRSGATASRIAQLTVVDMLFIAVAQSNRESAVRALTATREAINGRFKRQ